MLNKTHLLIKTEGGRGSLAAGKTQGMERGLMTFVFQKQFLEAFFSQRKERKIPSVDFPNCCEHFKSI